MADTDEDDLASLAPDVRDALTAYRETRSAETWTTLSQMYAGLIQVFDAVKAYAPDFPDAYPLAAADISDTFYEWPQLPDPEMVVKAVLQAVGRGR
jgi:hypothetical protein